MPLLIMSIHDSSIDNQDDYEKALTHTIGEDAFNARATTHLTATIGDEEVNDEEYSEDIKNILIETLDNEGLENNPIDFYPEDDEESFSRLMQTQSQDWDSLFETVPEYIGNERIDDRLADNSIPGRYKVVRILGTGATGQVFDIIDNNLHRNIAVKFMHPKNMDNVQRTKRFIQEAVTTAQLNHPNILPIHDLDYTDGALPFFTMRKVSGLSLEAIIKKSNGNNDDEHYTYVQQAGIFIKICDAIAYAHDKGIVHGDIKPENIMLGKYGDVTVLDWGTSTTLEERDKNNGKMQGTPMYMSPEQARRETCDELSDIYCIGSSLLHMLTQRYPVAPVKPELFWKYKKQGAYQVPSESEKQTIPGPLLAIAEKAMSKDRKNRYPSIQTLREDLLAYQSGDPISAYQDSTWDIIKRLYQKNKTAVFLTLTSIIILSVIGVFFYLEKLKEQGRWHLIFEEDFENFTQTDLAQSWRGYQFLDWSHEKRVDLDLNKTERWHVANGQLHRSNSYTGFPGNCNIKPIIEVSGNLRVNWDVRGEVKAPHGNAFISGEDRFNAYTFHIGWPSSTTVVLTKGLKLTALTYGTLDKPLRAKTTYRFSMERLGERIRFSIDDQLIIDYADPIPLSGAKYNNFGFEGGSIDNVQVLAQSIPQKIQSIALADDYLHNDQPALALMAYDDLRNDLPTTHQLSPLALYRSARCLRDLDRPLEAAARMRQFISTYPEHQYLLDAYLNLTDIYVDLKDFEKIYHYFDITSKRFHQSERSRWLCNNIVDLLYEESGITYDTIVEENALEKTMGLVNKIVEIENKIGYKLKYELVTAKQRCSFILLSLGYPELLLKYYPLSRYTTRYYGWNNDGEALKKHFPESKGYAYHLIKAGDYPEFINRFGQNPNILENYFGHPEALEELLLYLDAYPELKTGCEYQLRINTMYFRILPSLIGNKEYEKAYELFTHADTPHIGWPHEFIKNLVGHAQDNIDADQADRSAVAQAYVIKAMHAWYKGDKVGCYKLIDEVKAYRKQYLSQAFNSFIFEPFMHWLDNNDKEAFIKSIKERIEMIGSRYNNQMRTELKFLLDEITLDELLQHPRYRLANGKPDPYIEFLNGLKAELSGDQKTAITHYKVPQRIISSDVYEFARLRVEALEGSLNE